MRRARSLTLLALLATVFLSADVAQATVRPGIPDPAAPGVPGNGRAWELVTPADPINAQIFFPKGFSPGGDDLFFTTFGPLPGSAGGFPLVLSGIARRGSDGWTSKPVTGPDEKATPFLDLFQPNAFNAQLTEWIWTSRTSVGSETAIFLGTDGGGFDLLTETAYGTPFRGASTDLQHVLFATSMHLVPGDATRTEGSSIYEVVGSTVRLVDVGNDGSLLSNCGSSVPPINPISNDGRRIFFTTKPGCAGPQRAYLRQDGATTTLISASQCTLADCGPEADVTLLGATPSGSSAFLLTSQRLTNDDADETADLYRYDGASGQLTLLSAVPGAGELKVTEDKIRIAANGTTVLFWGEDPAVGSGKHLYLATTDGARLLAPSAEAFAQVSDDGRFALLATDAQLASGDTDAKIDVYRYDTSSETFSWLSHASQGGNGGFDATISSTGEGSFTGENEATPGSPYRAMTVDGSDVFFTTAEQLLPEDLNDVDDIYEWKGGHLSILTGGSGDRKSIYISPTADGRTVFFGTANTLLARDRDGGDEDIYAARIGGGFPEPAPPASCQGEECFPPLPGRALRGPTETAGASGHRILVHGLGRSARKRIAKSGWIPLLVEVPRAGRLVVDGWAKLGSKRRLVASKTVKAPSAGPVTLRLRLSKKARAALASGKRLRIELVLELAGARSQTVVLSVGGRR